MKESKTEAELDQLFVQLDDICDQMDAALENQDLHTARRLNVEARMMVAQVYDLPVVQIRRNGGRAW